MSEIKLTDQEQELVGLIEKNLKAAMGEATVKEAEAIRDEFNAKMSALKNEMNYESLQKQLDTVFAKFETMKPAIKTDKSKENKALANMWVRAFIKRDKKGMDKASAELKGGGGWAPGDGGAPLLVDGPDVMQGAPGFDIEQGAVLVPELLLAEVNRWVEIAGLARKDMRFLPFGGPGNTRRIPFLLRSVVIEWVDQGGIKPKSKPYIGDVYQTLEKLAVIVPMTEEIVEDVSIDLVALCGQLIGEAFAIEEDRVFFAGDVALGDPFNGVINAAGVTAVPLGGAALTPESIDPLSFAVPTPALNGGKFYMNRQTLSALRTLRVDAIAAGDQLGQFIVQQPTVSGQPWTLWGYPIELTDALPAFSAVGVGDPFMFFSNLQKTCVYGEKQGIRTKILTEATLTDAMGGHVSLAERDMIALRAYKRVGYVPVLPDGIAVVTA